MEMCMTIAAPRPLSAASKINSDLKRSHGLLPLRHSLKFVVRAVATSVAESSEDRGAADGSDEIAQTSGQGSFRLEPTRKLKEKRSSQWSTGTSPGEYGGPPLQTGLRKMWGGDEADPLTETGEYIWKKNWQPYVETPPSEMVPPPAAEKEPESGFLSLNRAIALDSMDVDLSKELMRPSKATLERQVREARNNEITERQNSKDESPKWRFAPTKREEIRWTSARKATTGGMEKMARELGRRQVDPVVAAETERKKYLKLKQDLQILTLAIGGLGAAGAYFAYSPEVAGSYGAGLIGALAYVRMLGNSVDSIGARDTGTAARGALGQPRLLVPVVLVMFYNRWNALLVPEYHLMSLQLIPMLVGFFTYKAATLVETFREVLPKQAEEDL
ncbi:hypothetical protein R1flu_000492 [Riccia fluitans]|uniref:CGL160/ATPI domain-containing protein n=1 Tax=Riccia fluitans TaxID=41844 RepID=A0ABD1Y3J8_9MARC